MSECVTDVLVGHRQDYPSYRVAKRKHGGLYVIGPVSNIPDDNRPAFEEARKRLQESGYSPVGIPHDSIEPGTPWEQAMRMSICNMLMYMDHYDEGKDDLVFDRFEYDGIAMLDGWEKSNGASLEHEVAVAVGMPCRTVEEWCSISKGGEAA